MVKGCKILLTFYIYGSVSTYIRMCHPTDLRTPPQFVSPTSNSLLIHAKYQNSRRVCPLGHFDEILKGRSQRGSKMDWLRQEVLKRFVMSTRWPICFSELKKQQAPNLFPPVAMVDATFMRATDHVFKMGNALSARDASFCLVSVATARSLQTDIMGHRHLRLPRAKNTALSANRTRLINGWYFRKIYAWVVCDGVDAKENHIRGLAQNKQFIRRLNMKQISKTKPHTAWMSQAIRTIKHRLLIAFSIGLPFEDVEDANLRYTLGAFR